MRPTVGSESMDTFALSQKLRGIGLKQSNLDSGLFLKTFRPNLVGGHNVKEQRDEQIIHREQKFFFLCQDNLG